MSIPNEITMNIPSEIIAALIGVIAMFLVQFFYNPQKKKNDDLQDKVDKIERDLADYKLHVSERFVTSQHLDNQMSRLEKAMDEVKGMIKALMLSSGKVNGE